MIDEGTTVHVIMEVITPMLTGITQVCIITYDRWGYVYSFRDRPFNLQGGGYGFLFHSELFLRTTRELEYLFFFQNFTGYMTKTLNHIIFFFLHQNHNIFFSNIGNQNFFLENNHNLPFKLNGPSLIHGGL